MFRAAKGMAILVAIGVVACSTPSKKKKRGDIEDFSLGVDESDDFDNSSSHFHGSIQENSSLPLPIKVGRGGPDFSSTPKLASQVAISKVELIKGKCRFSVQSGPILVDRFLWTNRWVKYQMALKSRQEVRLEPNMYGNFRASMDLFIHIPSQNKSLCKKEFEGKRTLLGYFHFNKSKFGLIKSPKSPKARFKMRGGDRIARPAYLNWPRGRKWPQLQDQYELPSSLSSPIHRAKFGNYGRYFISIFPVLSFKISPKSLVSFSKPQKKGARKSQRLGH